MSGDDRSVGETTNAGGVDLRPVTTLLSACVTALGLIWAGDAMLALGIALMPEQVLAAVLALALGVIYLTFDFRGAELVRTPWHGVLLAALGLGFGLYLAIRYPVLSQESFYRPVETNIVGGVLVVLVAESLRRTSGTSLFLVLMAFFAYALFGHLVPGKMQGRSLPPDTFFQFLGIDNVAMLGLPITVITGVVIVFVFFGQLLLMAGGSAFFTDIAAALMGRSRGGSAKIAVVASGLFGSISGSAVSNVVSTGVLTIPLMKQSGYRPQVAGAIEAVASTGGQIMPPIMGAAAFLMVELLGVTYQAVVIAALIPSLLYFMSVFIQADLEAAKHGIAPIPEDRIPAAGKVMREGWYFIAPFVLLLYALFQWNVQPEKAALYALALIVVLGLFLSYQGKRLTPAIIWNCITSAGKSSVDIVVIGAAAGLILGILDRTGLSFGLTIILVELGGNSLLALLLMTAVIAIILGMGMPTTAIYFLLATLAAPPIIKLGVDPLAAHMFVLYFGMMSMISPPVALAAFTAAKLADAPPMATAVASCRFGWPAFIIPFLFVLAPVLIMKGSFFAIAIAAVTAMAGIWVTSGGLTGYLFGHLSLPVRLGLIASGLCLLLPSQTFPNAWMLEVAGAVVAAILLTFMIAGRNRTQ
ncbi:MAG: TRAP transporter fused permease subunit [Hyphomicrobiales bacterium]|nr:TRAP transporter fused permease subunit [Hyphomicrobiales bacterium]